MSEATDNSDRHQALKMDLRRLRLRHVLLVFLGGGLAWYVWPFLDPHSEQDRCTFGTGSTALYERMRAEADTYLANHGRVRLAGYSDRSAARFSLQLTKQLRHFAMSRSTAAERMAAMHALLRAYGMEFDVMGPRDKDKLSSDLVVLSGKYIVLLPRLNWFCPLCYVFREGSFGVSIRNRSDGIYDQAGGVLDIFLNIFYSPVYYERFYQICPEVLK